MLPGPLHGSAGGQAHDARPMLLTVLPRSFVCEPAWPGLCAFALLLVVDPVSLVHGPAWVCDLAEAVSAPVAKLSLAHQARRLSDSGMAVEVAVGPRALKHALACAKRALSVKHAILEGARVL